MGVGFERVASSRRLRTAVKTFSLIASGLVVPETSAWWKVEPSTVTKRTTEPRGRRFGADYDEGKGREQGELASRIYLAEEALSRDSQKLGDLHFLSESLLV